MTLCPICRSNQSEQEQVDEYWRYKCPLCGTYYSRSFDFDILSANERLALSCAARQASEAEAPLRINADNYQSIAESHLRPSVSGNLERLLQAIAAKMDGRPGSSVPFNAQSDFTWIDCFTATEFDWYIQRAAEERLIPAKRPGTRTTISLTLEGWERAQPLAPPGGTPGRCFVAMSFAPDLHAAYTLGIEPAIKRANLQGGWLKEDQHNDSINDRIIAGIRESQVVIADVTGQCEGVYFEAGFAMALGRQVIWCCRKDKMENVHFNVNHFNLVEWETPADLQHKLYHRIQSSIIQPH